MKRQMRDKDRMVEELSGRVGTLVQQSRESDERLISTVEDLRREVTDRQVANDAKMDALMDLVRQLVDRRN